MKLTVNAAGFNNSVYMGTKDGQSVRTVKNAAFGGATKLGEDPVAKRREEARRQAWKVVENAWKNDRSVDDTIQSHRDSYAELENRKKGALAAIDETNQQKEALREQCGVDADSQEQQDLLLLEKEQDYKNGVLDEGLTDEEYDRLAEIHKKPLTEYQKQALELYYDLLSLKEPPMRILFLIARQFNQMYQIKDLREQGYDSGAIAKKAGLAPFIAKKSLAQASKFEKDTLRQAVEDCVETEAAVKSGRLGDRLGVELLIVKYSS